MNLLRRLALGQEQRSHDMFNTAPVRLGLSSFAGADVTTDSAMGLAAAAAAVRVRAEIIGSIPMIVYEGEKEDRERAQKSWQYELLHDEPHPDFSPFDFFQDLSVSLDTAGNAFVWKGKVEGRVEFLFPLDPGWVRVRVEDGKRLYEIRTGSETVTKDSSTILHVRGWTTSPGAPVGVSPIELHRQNLGHAIAKDEYIGRFFQNDAHPGGAIELPENTNAKQAREVYEAWKENHQGPARAHNPAVLFAGAKWHNVTFSPSDTQFIEAQRGDVETIARIFRCPPSLLYLTLKGQDIAAHSEALRFTKFDLGPSLTRIEKSLRKDPDLFGRTDLFPEFLVDALVKPDIKTRYDAYRLARQGGWVTPNEIRKLENMPPVEGGDDILQTPVGGAPNEGDGPTADTEEEESEEEGE